MLRTILLALCLASGASASAAEWQWSAEVTSVRSDEIAGGHPRAFLWIPPDCKRVRGVVVGQHNMLEECILEHPAMRSVLAEIGFAEVWVTPAFDPLFLAEEGAGEQFEHMMAALADESGYGELKFAPVVPIGHSAMASYPYLFAIWSPNRTLAAISCKGAWPDYRDERMPSHRDGSLDGVPLLFFNGEYEDADGRAAKALDFRKRNPKSPLTMCADAGGGHFDCHDRMVEYLAGYVKAAAKHRLPEASPPFGAPVRLKRIDPENQGWLAERWRPNAAPKTEPGPVGKYEGDPSQAFWFFDKELADATVAYNAREIRKGPQLLGYVQGGKLVPQDAPHTHQQVSLKFLPGGDGLTFKLGGTFLDAVPSGRPVTWTGQPEGSTIDHASGGGPVVIDRICGPVVKVAPDTFAVRFYRMGMNNTKRTNDIWLQASHPGDDAHKRAVQQAQLRIPFRNKSGADQTITFPKIPDVTTGTRSVQLRATSSANVPVFYYVREGPAEVDDAGKVTFTSIPPRAKYPVKVTVVAWQWGRAIEPKLRSAEPLEQTFAITTE